MVQAAGTRAIALAMVRRLSSRVVPLSPMNGPVSVPFNVTSNVALLPTRHGVPTVLIVRACNRDPPKLSHAIAVSTTGQCYHLPA